MAAKPEQSRSRRGDTLRITGSTLPTRRAIVVREAGASMKNGLYSIHIHMLDGVKGRDSGVLILRDGVLLGGGPYFWSRGSYTFGEGTCGNGTWKGELATNQHSPLADPLVRPLFAGTEATSGFSGTFSEEGAEVYGTVLVAGHRSLGFRATLKWLAEI